MPAVLVVVDVAEVVVVDQPTAKPQLNTFSVVIELLGGSSYPSSNNMKNFSIPVEIPFTLCVLAGRKNSRK